MSMDEVLCDLTDDRIGDFSTLLARETMNSCRESLDVFIGRTRLDLFDTRRSAWSLIHSNTRARTY